MTARPMSVFLLKVGRTAHESLDDDHALDEVPISESFPLGSRFFVQRGHPRRPWWVDYFGVDLELRSLSNGALAFIPAGDRIFALAFGSARHELSDDSFEHDFGTRVVLNSVDPERLKSTDMLEPGSSRRQRTQLPFDADLSYFGELGDTAVLKSLTGKVGSEISEIVRSITGTSSLRITAEATPAELVTFLEDCLDLASRTDYKERFPGLRWLEPVTDPAELQPLMDALLAAIFDTEARIGLTIPDIVDYEAESLVRFAGAGASDVYDDVYIKHYRQYLESASISSAELTLDQLRRHKLELLDEQYQPRHRYSIFRSLILELPSNDGQHTFHLSDGIWYRVADDLIVELTDYLDARWRSTTLPAHNYKDEASYNKSVASEIGAICLDRTSLAPQGQTAVEPCDILRMHEGRVDFVHVKIGTNSDKLSHHFNQGVNSLTLLIDQDEARKKLLQLILERSTSQRVDEIRDAIEQDQVSITFAIVTHKDEFGRSANLPLFSKLSLRGQLRTLERMRAKAYFEFVPNATEVRVVRVGGHAKREPQSRELTCCQCNIRKLPHLLADGTCDECLEKPHDT